MQIDQYEVDIVDELRLVSFTLMLNGITFISVTWEVPIMVPTQVGSSYVACQKHVTLHALRGREPDTFLLSASGHTHRRTSRGRDSRLSFSDLNVRVHDSARGRLSLLH